MSRRRPKLIVFAAERYDVAAGVTAAEPGQSVGVQSPAVDHAAGTHWPRRRLQHDRPGAVVTEPRYPRPAQDPVACGRHQLGQLLADAAVIDDAGLRDVDGAQPAGGVGLQLAEPLRTDQLALHAVGLAA